MSSAVPKYDTQKWSNLIGLKWLNISQYISPACLSIVVAFLFWVWSYCLLPQFMPLTDKRHRELIHGQLIGKREHFHRAMPPPSFSSLKTNISGRNSHNVASGHQDQTQNTKNRQKTFEIPDWIKIDSEVLCQRLKQERTCVLQDKEFKLMEGGEREAINGSEHKGIETNGSWDHGFDPPTVKNLMRRVSVIIIT